VITLNATAIFELSRNSARLLIRKGRGGRVINIAALEIAEEVLAQRQTEAQTTQWQRSSLCY
jgi:hypothetical protein